MKNRRNQSWLYGLVLPAALLASPGAVQAQAIQDKVEGRNAWLNKAFTKLTTKARVHVVSIRSSDDSKLAYGVVVEPGIVLTIASALPDSNDITVADLNNSRFTVKGVARNGANNIALVRIEGGPTPIAIGSEKALSIGSFVVACGTKAGPLAVGVLSAKGRAVTRNKRQQNMLMGLLGDGNSGHDRDYPRVIHHDAPVQTAQFGSPLLDAKGRLVGINVATPFRGSSHAVGIDQIKTFLKALKAGQSTAAPKRVRRPRPRTGPTPSAGKRPWLGASLKPATKAERGIYEFGLLVAAVAGPAAKGGMKTNDVVVSIDGTKFDSIDAFAEKLMAKKPGDTVKLTVLRGKAGVLVDLTIKLGVK